MKSKLSEEESLVNEVTRYLDDPETGIEGQSKEAILQLFGSVFLNREIDPNIKAKWERLGRLENGKISFDTKYPEVDLCIMSLEWDGLISRVPVRAE
jgi:hypothetical protein